MQDGTIDLKDYEIREIDDANVEAALRLVCESFAANQDTCTFLGIPAELVLSMFILPDVQRSFRATGCSFVVCRKDSPDQILAASFSQELSIGQNDNPVSLVH